MKSEMKNSSSSTTSNEKKKVKKTKKSKSVVKSNTNGEIQGEMYNSNCQIITALTNQVRNYLTNYGSSLQTMQLQQNVNGTMLKSKIKCVKWELKLHVENETEEVTQFYLHIICMNGQTYSLFVDRSDTIKDVKKKIETRYGIPINQQCLYNGGTILEDRHTLAHYNINESTSTVYLKLLDKPNTAEKDAKDNAKPQKVTKKKSEKKDDFVETKQGKGKRKVEMEDENDGYVSEEPKPKSSYIAKSKEKDVKDKAKPQKVTKMKSEKKDDFVEPKQGKGKRKVEMEEENDGYVSEEPKPKKGKVNIKPGLANPVTKTTGPAKPPEVSSGKPLKSNGPNPSKRTSSASPLNPNQRVSPAKTTPKSNLDHVKPPKSTGAANPPKPNHCANPPKSEEVENAVVNDYVPSKQEPDDINVDKWQDYDIKDYDFEDYVEPKQETKDNVAKGYVPPKGEFGNKLVVANRRKGSKSPTKELGVIQEKDLQVFKAPKLEDGYKSLVQRQKNEIEVHRAPKQEVGYQSLVACQEYDIEVYAIPLQEMKQENGVKCLVAPKQKTVNRAIDNEIEVYRAPKHTVGYKSLVACQENVIEVSATPLQEMKQDNGFKCLVAPKQEMVIRAIDNEIEVYSAPKQEVGYKSLVVCQENAVEVYATPLQEMKQENAIEVYATPLQEMRQETGVKCLVTPKQETVIRTIDNGTREYPVSIDL